MTTPELDEEPHAADRPVAARKYTNSSVKELAANEYAHTEPLTTPVEQCFDWARELPDLVATSHGALEFYLVVFRSIRKSSANSDQLYSADAAAHDEARLSGGLLKVNWSPHYSHFITRRLLTREPSSIINTS